MDQSFTLDEIEQAHELEYVLFRYKQWPHRMTVQVVIPHGDEVPYLKFPNTEWEKVEVPRKVISLMILQKMIVPYNLETAQRSEEKDRLYMFNDFQAFRRWTSLTSNS